jgi:large subunit ribosomal protein L23
MIDLIKKISLTNKSAILLEMEKYTFHVDVRLTKPKIKALIEDLYNVKVLSVNTHRPPRKKRRLGGIEGTKPKYKKAIVTLKPNNQILIYN